MPILGIRNQFWFCGFDAEVCVLGTRKQQETLEAKPSHCVFQKHQRWVINATGDNGGYGPKVYAHDVHKKCIACFKHTNDGGIPIHCFCVQMHAWKGK